jgi:UDP-N-acetylmuramoylalanine--D-glutamate ligase
VVGLGASGLAAARLLESRGAHVLVNDKRSEAELGEVAAEARDLGAELVLGSHDPSVFTSVSLIVVSPGVPRLQALSAAEAQGIPIVSEVELASWFLEGTIIGITGTNGKSTVATLVGEMCRRTGRPTFVGGNLGVPFVDAVGTDAGRSNGFLVIELSSFQLERVDRFRAQLAVLLNVSDDHLDRYDSVADYAAAKGRIFDGQHPGDVAIVPSSDELCASLARSAAADLHFFGEPNGEVRVVGDRIENGVSGLGFPIADLRILGGHNVDNACAAALTARLAGVDVAHIESVLREFSGLPHRMQHVRTLDGVDYYDDSKATNVGATAAALDGLVRVTDLGRAVVLIGESAELIETALHGAGVPVTKADDLVQAVSKARSLAEPGDVVLLAPACSSFDMFRSYVDRGEAYQRAVRAQPEGS